ncbi:Type I restriction enzyme EcoKI specificity protein [Fusobacterium polymorphum]|uniref:restriction endonuclease subunit S n=1 Tax=Fusobacterium nucleatum subsp. polymorphum TaxID=76857 RepID=UPI0005DA36C8|nr:restriction endonuclease subunit S [Fusobacterium polymorphum]UTI52335.1 restriction endonuclease subunit S [Fusobacterium polymorphum]CKH01864.1 Type I restriction enzyme EcoKI specificity protein [Fusobacterium polymorphum]
MRIGHKKILLKEVATFLNGYAFKPSDWSKEGLPIIRIQNLTGTNRDFNYYNGNYNKKYLIENGDILISWSASLGIFLWENMTGILNQHIFKVIFDKNIEIDKIYFLHCMKFLIKKIEKNIHGSTMKHITRPEFEKIKFPIYEIDIQRKISKKLIFITKIIENNKKLLNKMEELSKSLFTRMFGDIKTNDKNWKIVKLEKYINIIGGYAFKNIDFKSSGIPLIRIGNINSGQFKSTNLVFIEENKKFEKFKVFPNDILISLTGTVGKDDYGNACILGDSYSEYYLNQRNAKIELTDKMNKNFFLEIMKIKEVKKKLTGISRGIRQANISNKDIYNLSLPLPPIELQNKFAERVEKIEKLKFTIWKIILKFSKILEKKGVESN